LLKYYINDTAIDMSDTDTIQSDSVNEETEMEEEIIIIEGNVVNSESDSNNDSDSDSDTSYNSHLTWRYRNNPEQERLQENIDRIYDSEVEFLDTEKENHKYYLGLCKEPRGQRILLGIAIQPKTFLKFDIQSILNYLAEYSIFTIYRRIMDTSNIQLQIMCLNIEPITGFYTVILKTYWIRIIQRTWKRVFRERQEMLMKRRTPQNMRYFEIHGKHLQGIRVLPTIHYMLRKNIILSRD